MMSFLASPTFVSLPCEVIHLNPPNKMMTTATMPRKPSAMRMRDAIVDVRSASWRPALVAKSAPVSLLPKKSFGLQ